MRRYLVVIEKTATGYSGYPPDLPGCAATARTLAAVRRVLAGAIAAHIAGLREDGDPIPEPSSICEYLEVQEESGTKPNSRR
jgi:predicted RNase H-like HicB family nuclease